MSLGTFGTSFAARAEATRRVEDGQWIRDEISVPVYGVTIFERSPADGNFYAAVSIPFESRNIDNCNIPKTALLQDAAASLSHSFKGTCSGVLWELRRASQAVAGENMRIELSVYGSHVMDAALPCFSDIDTVIEITPVGSNVSPICVEDSSLIFLVDVMSLIKVSTVIVVEQNVPFPPSNLLFLFLYH